MRKKGAVEEKSFAFALAIIDFSKRLKELREYEIASQVLRSGTSIGANVREAQRGLSKKDFSLRIGIALKEADETKYWLELIDIKILTVENDLMERCEELIRLLVSIRKSAQS